MLNVNSIFVTSVKLMKTQSHMSPTIINVVLGVIEVNYSSCAIDTRTCCDFSVINGSSRSGWRQNG